MHYNKKNRSFVNCKFKMKFILGGKMIKTKETITFSREIWDELYQIDYYREVLEAIEDRELLRKAKENAQDFVSFREYDAKRKQRINV